MNFVPSDFWGWMAELDSGEWTGLLVLSVIGSVFVVSMLLCTVYLMHKNRLEDSLKRELLDRGMSADEIAAVVRARPTKKCGQTMHAKLGGNS